MGPCLGTAPSIESVVARDSTVQGVMPRSSKSLEGHNSLNTCSNEASEESIRIYTKIKCQWSGCAIKKTWTREIWLFEAAGALGIALAAKTPRGLGGLPKQKCVLEVP